MELMLEQRGDVKVLAVPGDALVSSGVEQFKRDAEGQLASGGKVLLDLSSVHFIDSSGCAALLSLQRVVRERGGDLRVFGANPTVRAMFEQLRIQRVLPVYPGREEALRGLEVVKP
jgi:anti-sigma B factor antagonist